MTLKFDETIMFDYQGQFYIYFSLLYPKILSGISPRLTFSIASRIIAYPRLKEARVMPPMWQLKSSFLPASSEVCRRGLSDLTGSPYRELKRRSNVIQLCPNEKHRSFALWERLQ